MDHLLLTLFLLVPTCATTSDPYATPDSIKIGEYTISCMSCDIIDLDNGIYAALNSPSETIWVAYLGTEINLINGDIPGYVHVCDSLDYLKKEWFDTDNTYDRGHLAPAHHFDYSLDALRSCNCYKNIVPQHPYINRGIWRSVEYEANTAVIYDTTLIITGAKYANQDYTTDIRVPTSIWKIIKNDYMEVAYDIPNIMMDTNNKNEFECSMEYIERINDIIIN